MLKTLKNKSPKFKILKLKIIDFVKKQLWVYAIVFGTIALCSWLFNRWIEGIMFSIAHTCIRNAFDKQFHFNKIAYCLTLTLAIIWFAIPITLPIATSILSSIPIAFGICFVGYIAEDRIELLIYKRRNEMFNLKTCTEEQLIDACNKLGYNKDKQELATMFFIHKLSNTDVWKRLCEQQKNVDIDTVKQYKYRMKKELKKLVKE